MKGPQLALVLWIANIVVVGGGGYLGFKVFTGVGDERKQAHRTVQDYERKNKPISNWDDSGNDNKSLTLPNNGFSPYKRPPPPAKPKPPVKPKLPVVVQPPTEKEQLAATARWVDDNFNIVRLGYASKPSAAFALVTIANTGKLEIMVWPELNFDESWGKHKEGKKKGQWKVADKNRQKLSALKITIKSVEQQALVLEVPNKHTSPKADKSKRFEIALKLDFLKLRLGDKYPDFSKYSKETSNGSGGTGTVVDTPEEPPSDPRIEKIPPPLKESIEKDGVWEINPKDYKGLDVDALTRDLKVVLGADGKPFGIQISENAKDDSLLLKRGGRRGDIIISINGKKVISMSDARRIVRTDYDKGVDSFEVIFERDGESLHKNFNVPRKKNTEDK